MEAITENRVRAKGQKQKRFMIPLRRKFIAYFVNNQGCTGMWLAGKFNISVATARRWINEYQSLKHDQCPYCGRKEEK